MRIDEFEGVTQSQLNALERVLDQVFAKLGIDVEFTRHFLDRVNDERNITPITIKELGQLFAKEFKKWGKPIAQMGPDAEAVMKDLSSDINLPFALNWNKQSGMLELVAKTVMRKKNFRTPNKEFPVEAAMGEQGIEESNPFTDARMNAIKAGKKHFTVKGKKYPVTGDTSDEREAIANENIMDENGLPPHLAKHFDKDGDAVKGSWKDGEWKADKKQPKKVKYTIKDVTPKGYGPLDEDFGSVPPLSELIVMAVVAKTSVDVLIGMFKVALKTGKGLKKLNQLRKKVQGIGQGIADYAMPESLEEATREELLSQLKDRQKQKFYQAALDALHRLVSSKGGKQSVGGYAFDIARAFNGIDGKELEKMYSELHEKVNVIRQSDPLDVLDTLSTRKDNIVHPIKFYDGDVLKVSVEQARRFMNAYYKMDDEKREIVDKYIKTKNGFQQAIKSLEVRENAFDLLSAALDWKKDK